MRCDKSSCNHHKHRFFTDSHLWKLQCFCCFALQSHQEIGSFAKCQKFSSSTAYYCRIHCVCMAEYAFEIEFVSFSPQFFSLCPLSKTDKIRPTRKTTQGVQGAVKRWQWNGRENIACVSTFQGVNERYNFQIHPTMSYDTWTVWHKFVLYVYSSWYLGVFYWMRSDSFERAMEEGKKSPSEVNYEIFTYILERYKRHH